MNKINCFRNRYSRKVIADIFIFTHLLSTLNSSGSYPPTLTRTKTMIRHSFEIPLTDSVKSFIPTTDSPTPDSYTAVSVDFLKRYSHINKIWDDNPLLLEHNISIVKCLHSYEDINLKIRSHLIKKDIKITNAFMKMYEWLLYMSKYFKNYDSIKHFDIASAPGTFVLASDCYFGNRNIKYNWYASSAKDGDLQDYYGLFRNNKKNYRNCDVCVEEDLRSMIKYHQGKYDLVTGDIGKKSSGYETLQEYQCLNEQYGQARLAMDLCKHGGVCFLKMFTITCAESMWLVDVMRLYFDKVSIVKPYTSRFMNAECYIMAVGRNSVECTLPLLRPNVVGYRSDNADLYNEIEEIRYAEKIDMLDEIIRCLSENGFDAEKLKQSEVFNKYFEKLQLLYDLFTLKIQDKDLAESLMWNPVRRQDD